MPSLKKDLDRADAIRLQFGTEFEDERFELFKQLDADRFKTPKDLTRFHELISFARAWPDSPRVHRLTRRIAKAFARREDVQQLRTHLEGSGIAGSDLPFSFFLPTANWLARSWPEQLDIDWDLFDEHERLDELLKHAALFAEQQGLNSYGFNGLDRIQKLRGKNKTPDGTFVLSLLELLDMDERVKEHFYDALALPFVLRPGPDTPSRTTAEHRVSEIHYQDQPLASTRIDLRQTARQALVFTKVTGATANRLIALAREAMVTRMRDLDPIAYADPNDVRVTDCGEGIQIVLIGIVTERRLLLESEYAHLILKNGVPVGYGSAWSLYGTCSLNFNVFPTFRGAQAMLLFARVFAAYHRLFDADAFVAEPYQLGDENEEAIQSGAWWFYNKLGYKPVDRAAVRLANAEIKKRQTRKHYRSSPATLRRLGLYSMYFFLERPRKDVLGQIELEACGLAVTDYLSKRNESDRARAEAKCRKTVCGLLDIDPRKLSPSQRLWLRRWSPLVAALGSVNDWSKNDKTALRAVVLAKGGPDQSQYVQLFDRHKKLRQAILQLSRKALKDLS